MVSEDERKRYSGSIDVDVKGRSFMRRSLNRISLKRSVPEQRAKSSISDKESRDVGSTATVLKAGKPLSFASGNPLFSGDVDGPVEKELAKPLSRARGAKAPRGKAPRGGKKAAATKKPLTTEFGSLARQDTRPIVYAVSAWCMVMPAAQAAQEVIKAKAGAARVAAGPDLSVADSLEEGSEVDESELAPKLKPEKGKKKKKAAAAAEPEGRARAGSFRKFFGRKGKKGKKKGADK